MDHKEIKHLLNYLDNNKKAFSTLQMEFIDSLRKHYKITGLLTTIQVESLYSLKEKVISGNNIVPDAEFISGLYSQLQENYC